MEKPISQYTLYSLIFSPLRSVVNGKQHEKYPYNQSSHNRKYTECSIVRAHASFKVGMLLGHGSVSLLDVWIYWTAFQAKNNVWSAPACSALTLVSHRSHTQIFTFTLRKKGMEYKGIQRRTKVIFGKTMM